MFTLQDSRTDKIFMVSIYLFLFFLFVIVSYPLLYIFSASFSDPIAVMSGKVWLFPVDFSLKGYEAVFNYRNIWVGYKNSLIYASLGTLINVSLTIMLAYPLSKKDFHGRNLIMMLLVFTMFFSGGLIPTYFVVRELGILNTLWAMVIPQALAVWQVIICRTFFQMNIPNELSEAAELDGCSDIGFIARVVIPLSKPIIAVLTLMYVISHWNAYFDALIFLRSRELYPLQLILRNVLLLNEMQASSFVNLDSLLARQALRDLLKYSMIVVACVPVLILYPFIQRHFVKGVLIGSLKG